MQITQTTCDRCQELVDPTEVVELNLITTLTVEDEESVFAEMWDLCPTCREVIRDALIAMLSPVP